MSILQILVDDDHRSGSLAGLRSRFLHERLISQCKRFANCLSGEMWTVKILNNPVNCASVREPAKDYTDLNARIFEGGSPTADARRGDNMLSERIVLIELTPVKFAL
jgi:hypothetical protein